MTLIEPKILKGFRDFLPDTEAERKRVRAVLEKTFESFGFVPVDTPVLEYTEVLLGKGGGETDKQMYRFRDNGDRDVAMRFDLTVPFARFMAAHFHDLYLPFKRYHIAKVFRGENSQKGRYREFTQCDFDTVGVDCASADFEILLLMRQSFINLGVKKLMIHFSHRGIFNRALRKRGIESASVEILRAVDKIKKSGEDEVRAELTRLCGSESAALILDFIRPEESNSGTLEKITALAGGEDGDSSRLSSILGWMKDMDIEDSFVLDPSITRGLDYYTGIVYETFLTDIPGIGSVCSGGRYNDLASLYTKEKLPGVGSSIGLDRLLAALEELGQKSRAISQTRAVIFCSDEKDFAAYHKTARSLREAGISAEVYPEVRKQANQFAFAEKKGIPFGIFLKNGTISLRDLRSRETLEGLRPESAAAEIKRRLDA
jgi:histidyl-tRNA synthetase